MTPNHAPVGAVDHRLAQGSGSSDLGGNSGRGSDHLASWELGPKTTSAIAAGRACDRADVRTSALHGYARDPGVPMLAVSTLTAHWALHSTRCRPAPQRARLL